MSLFYFIKVSVPSHGYCTHLYMC